MCLSLLIKEVVNEAKDHGKQFEWSEFFPRFFSATMENWQSEFLQLLTFVILTSFLIHKGSHESQDTDQRMERKLDEILAYLKEKAEGLKS